MPRYSLPAIRWPRPSGCLAAVFGGVLACSAPASAEVVERGDDSFVVRVTRTVEAGPREAWMALISPAKWWSDDHTWSGDAANMTLTPQAGGCFCERIPEVETAETVGLAGSVQHMEVIYAAPDSALRLRGALGPLQSEAATGVLTIAFDKAGEGTAITFEYVVGGYMRYDTETIAKAVDGVMAQQIEGLADLLGPRDGPAADKAQADKAETGEADRADTAEESESAADTPGRKSVEDAFGDISGD
ncbi:SRPBCC family protein [Pelagerythrobacter marensis]|uniref:SRPBCC family protein n=1 Tax=Pelagerythrobacter marensis TaxID=543877 RepID=A0ABZ2D184_9SPHN